MATLISGDYTTGIQLTLSSDNPVTVTGTIATTGGNARTGSALWGDAPVVSWNVDNQGLLSSSTYGIYLYQLGAVTNSGIVMGGDGVALWLGGAISNAAGGTIGGNVDGAVVSAVLGSRTTPGTVTNAGTISYGPDSYSINGVVLGFGGSVTNQSGALVKVDVKGIYIENGSGSVVNAGTILTSKASGTGVRLSGSAGTSAYLSNSSTGLIRGGGYGVSVGANTTTIVNDGTISGGAQFGVLANSGGTISNAAEATITAGGLNGIRLWNGPRTVDNAGLISATRTLSRGLYGTDAYGANLTVGTIGSAYVSNAASGTIIGVSGIGIGGATGTVVNAGTIEATAPDGYAVQFWKGSADTLVVDPGAAFVGTLNGGNTVGSTAISTLALASAASTGTLSGIGSQYINFAQITIDPGASWQWAGSNSISSGATLTNSGTLKLLGADLTDDGGLVNDGVISVDPSTLIVDGIVGTGSVDVGANSTLTINGTVTGGETIVFTGTNAVVNILDPSGFAGSIVGKGPTDQVNGLCFVAGTRITTERGMVAVEALCKDDQVRVTTPRGISTRPVVWIGYRHIDCLHHPQPRKVWPVRIRVGAFGTDGPCRDLFLSPDHAVFISDVLIPVKYLINGTSIAHVPRRHVMYYHVELPEHSILLAEGLFAESYLDTGLRSNFINGDGPVVLHPDFASHVWEAGGCAPLVVTGPVLHAARQWLNALAASPAHDCGGLSGTA